MVILCACKTTQKSWYNSIPAIINQKQATFSAEKVSNPPQTIYIYTYHGDRVYFIPAKCCDKMSELFDSSGNLIGHPDGGITGKGDGKCSDFFDTRTNEILFYKHEQD